MTPATLLPTLARAFIDIGEATLVGVSLSLSLRSPEALPRDSGRSTDPEERGSAPPRERPERSRSARARTLTLSLSLARLCRNLVRFASRGATGIRRWQEFEKPARQNCRNSGGGGGRGAFAYENTGVYINARRREGVSILQNSFDTVSLSRAVRV